MHIVLISTYELGHQPFGLASPAAWLRAAGAWVTCLDLAVQPERDWRVPVADAQLVAIYVPMHTATRLAAQLIKQIRADYPSLHICCYGLYAPLNESFLRGLGVDTILGGEFEQGLAALYRRLVDTEQHKLPAVQPEPRISLVKQAFLRPDRSTLPDLARYAQLQHGNIYRIVGYTEASRGCKHLCRHCPIVPVYGGRFRVVQRDIVLADIRQQVAAGAEHITFGDPDFFNGIGHALPLLQALHHEFPQLTYDVTIKIEHLLLHAKHLHVLRDTGCAFVTSAVEAVEDMILAIFDKRHSAADFARAVELMRSVGLILNPTFVAFTPWTSRLGYQKLLQTIARLELVEHVAPIQYAIRLLLPTGSKLLELPQVQTLVAPFDHAALCYPWTHPDPAMDRLQADVLQLVSSQARKLERSVLFEHVWSLAHSETRPAVQLRRTQAGAGARMAKPPVPQLSEPWYC